MHITRCAVEPVLFGSMELRVDVDVVIFRINVCLSEENSSSGTPPPLPPKRRTRAQQLLDESDGLLASSLDGVSLRSRSPEDSSSLLSASAGSLDSALNHSRDEDEIRAIMGPNDESLNDSMDLSLMATIQGKSYPTADTFLVI